MHIGAELSAFLSQALQISNEPDLAALLEQTARRLGFDHFALVNHVDYLHVTNALAVTNYHEDWIDRVLSQRYYLDDPVHAASTRTYTGFSWRDISRLIVPSKRQQRILEEAAEFGLRNGVTVPIHAPGEYRGTCSFARRDPFLLDSQLRGICQIVAAYAFEAARTIARLRDGRHPSRVSIPSLSPRQIDCIGLIAAGKGDAQIAGFLGVSEPTVHQHIGEAMRRYRVSKRPALVFRALFDGQICFQDPI